VKGKADAVEGSHRHQIGQDHAGQGQEFDAAGAYLAEQIGIRTQLAIREYLDVDLATGFRLGFSAASLRRMYIGCVTGTLVATL